jgi:dUTP pyrophosphatase
MNVNIKRLDLAAKIPFYAHPNDACMDVTAISETIINNDGYGYIEYGTGLAFEVPEDYVMLIFPRSSISNTGLILSNSVGVLDSGYQGELRFRFKYIKDSVKYNIGDRIGQIMVIPRPKIEFNEVEDFKTSERGDGGFGSSGK